MSRPPEVELEAQVEAVMQGVLKSEVSKPKIEQGLPKTSPNLEVDAGINMLSLNLKPLLLRLSKLKLDVQVRNRRNEIQINQKHANERFVRQYGIQRSVKVFELYQKISAAVSALNRAFIDGKRIWVWGGRGGEEGVGTGKGAQLNCQIVYIDNCFKSIHAFDPWLGFPQWCTRSMVKRLIHGWELSMDALQHLRMHEQNFEMVVNPINQSLYVGRTP